MKLICLCSGVGQRFYPLSIKYPKSLVPINGAPNIQNSIDFIMSSKLKSDIKEIIFAVDAFSSYEKRSDYNKMKLYLMNKYPRVLITTILSKYDPLEWNNCATMKVILNYLYDHNDQEELLVLEGDVYMKSSIVSSLNKYDYTHSALFCSNRSNEWVVSKDSDSPSKYVIDYSGTGLAMSGLSFITLKEVKYLTSRLSMITEEDKDNYWDEYFIKDINYPNRELINIDTNDSLLDYDTIDDLVSNKIMNTKELSELIGGLDNK